jgi:hypothetical protein
MASGPATGTFLRDPFDQVPFEPSTKRRHGHTSGVAVGGKATDAELLNLSGAFAPLCPPAEAIEAA